MGWLILIVMVVFVWVAFRELKTMEADILQDIARKSASGSDDGETNTDRPATDKPIREATDDSSLEGQLRQLIRSRPGVMQTDIYTALNTFDRKQIQQILLEMDRKGQIRRKKAKSSYQVFHTE